MSDADAREELREAVEAATQKMRGSAPTPGAFSNPPADEPLPIDWSTEPTPAAANGVQCLHTRAQFALLFTDLALFPGRNSPDGTAGNERARVVSSLRMDPDTYYQALCVMASNWNRFVEAHVPPQMRQPRFKLIDAGDNQLYGFKPKRDEDD